MSDYVVKTENLNVWYGKQTLFGHAKRTHILHDVSFELRRGEVLGLVGESGCGKSTLARAILGIEKDITGTITHRTFRPQMVFQNPYGSLNPYKKIGWIIEEPLRVLKKYNRKERKEKVLELLDKVGLPASYTERYPDELSGGQRQRVAIARALSAKAPLIMADEPTANLDSKNGDQILQLMKKLNKELNTTFVFSTHDQKIVGMSDHIIHIKDGVITGQDYADK